MKVGNGKMNERSIHQQRRYNKSDIDYDNIQIYIEFSYSDILQLFGAV